ncbi:hypothetical protein V8F33_008537 [Rhypophila sp. PSN 637]
MAGFTLLRFVPVALSLATIAAAAPAPELSPILLPGGDTKAIPVCQDIESKVSSASKVIWPFKLGYVGALDHWFASSSQNSTCVVQVGSVKDLSTAVKIVGDTRTPFAIKSGGHASNPGFSSTPSVHISMERMNQIILSADKKTVEVGFGNLWVDVYKAIESAGVNVVGGRVPGPGVGGFTLGGGYSWKTNQYGLTVDTVLSFDVVLPNGTFTRASASQNPDLFWALKGGTNRFGIVTSAVLETHPQPPQVYAGIAFYSASQVPALINATSRFFYENKDPKASVITTLEGSALTGASALALFFFDGPNKPDSFKLFDDAKPLVSTVKKQTFVQFISGIPSSLGEIRNPRGAFITMSTSEISQRFVEVVHAEAQAVSKEMALHGGIVASFDIEPFTNYGEHATESAYPHHASPIPLNVYFSWLTKSEDAWWWARMRQSINNITAQAKAEGIYVDAEAQPAYPNYSLFDEPVENMYGPTNAARLRALRQRYDPNRVMDLAGGFDI